MLTKETFLNKPQLLKLLVFSSSLGRSIPPREQVAQRGDNSENIPGGHKSRPSSTLSSTYNTHGEPLYGHSTANGTATNGNVLSYGSQAPAPVPSAVPPAVPPAAAATPIDKASGGGGATGEAEAPDSTGAEISDIDHRLNQLQDFLRQAKLDSSATSTSAPLSGAATST